MNEHRCVLQGPKAGVRLVHDQTDVVWTSGLHILAWHGVGSGGADLHRAVLGQVFSGHRWGRCSVSTIGAGVHRAVLEQVFSGHCWGRCSVGSVGAGVQWAVLGQVFIGQCWGRCSLGSVGAGVHWAVLGQVFTGHQGCVGVGVYCPSGQC